MKKHILLIGIMIFGAASMLHSQTSVISVRFTGQENTWYLAPDSIRIFNLSRDCDTLLIYPDTLILLGSTAIGKREGSGGGLLALRLAPNPVTDASKLLIEMKKQGTLTIRMINLRGAEMVSFHGNFPAGIHQFGITPGSDKVSMITAELDGDIQSIKYVNMSRESFSRPVIIYDGIKAGSGQTKSSDDFRSFVFLPGDRLLCVGYHDTLESGTIISPVAEEIVSFQFAYNIPCPGTPAVDYEGITYHTVQIFSQCWIRENLNIGVMIQGSSNQGDNGIIEKYCYDNNEDSCTLYGGFYQWGEMMAYTEVSGTQGICPPGWHVATDDDWKILEGAADSELSIGDTSWNINGVRGVDGGFHLKSGQYWENDGNGSDMYGFTVPPIGYRDYWGYIYGFGHAAKYWSADAISQTEAWSRGFGCHGRDISRYNEDTANGYSVRCIKN